MLKKKADSTDTDTDTTGTTLVSKIYKDILKLISKPNKKACWPVVIIQTT